MANLEQRVMGSVYAIYTVRKLMSRRALGLYALALSAIAVVSLVSVPNVAANFTAVAAGDLGSVLTYLLVAVTKTKIVVQLALLIGALGLTAFFADSLVSVAKTRNTFAA